MSNIYEKLVDHAEILVNIINKKYVAGNNMAYLALLSGVGNCRVESFAGAGHNYQAVIDAIHLYYADHPKSRANEGFEKELLLLCQAAGSMRSVQLALNCIIYEIYKEKKGNNTDSVVLNNVKSYCEMMILALDLNKKITNITGNEGK